MDIAGLKSAVAQAEPASNRTIRDNKSLLSQRDADVGGEAGIPRHAPAPAGKAR